LFSGPWLEREESSDFVDEREVVVQAISNHQNELFLCPRVTWDEKGLIVGWF